MKSSSRCISILVSKPQSHQILRASPFVPPSTILRGHYLSRTFGVVSRSYGEDKERRLSEHGPPWQALSQALPNIEPKLGGHRPEPTEKVEEQLTQDAVAPAYELTFTCKPCKTRSAHRITKQGYHKGSVLITCPNCKVRHVISDHLKIFGDEARSFEQILSKSGELIRKGTISEDGDLEFWENGAVTAREGPSKHRSRTQGDDSKIE